MRKALYTALLAGLSIGVGLLPARAQTSIGLSSGTADSLSFTGNGSGGLSTTLGTCQHGCSISGAATGSGTIKGASNFTINTRGPISLTSANGGASYSASGPGLAGATISVTNAAGATVFTGALSNLSFTQGANGQLSLQATATSVRNGSASISGIVQLAAGATLTGTASGTGTVSGSIVPEPATLLLFGIGLIGLGYLARRRLFAANPLQS